MRLALVALLLAGCNKTAETHGEKPTIRVAAAADLAHAFKEVGDAFEKRTGDKMSFSFGSTGLLAKQIQEGAPFDVFAAANISFVDDVVKKGVCADSSKSLYARGRIVIWTPKDAKIAPPKTLADLADARFAKIAIANPEHAPYGKAAQQALEKVGVWEKVRPKLVYGENVQQTLQFAQSGNVEAAIVALSLAVTSGGEFTPIDVGLHAPLDQAMVLCGRGPAIDEAGKFTAFVNSAEGRGIMRKFGFLLPGEQPPH